MTDQELQTGARVSRSLTKVLHRTHCEHNVSYRDLATGCLGAAVELAAKDLRPDEIAGWLQGASEALLGERVAA